MDELDQLGSRTRFTTGGGEEKEEAFATGSLSDLGRKAGAGEEKSSSHSKPPPEGI